MLYKSPHEVVCRMDDYFPDSNQASGKIINFQSRERLG